MPNKSRKLAVVSGKTHSVHLRKRWGLEIGDWGRQGPPLPEGVGIGDWGLGKAGAPAPGGSGDKGHGDWGRQGLPLPEGVGIRGMGNRKCLCVSSLSPAPCSLLPAPCSLLPAPCSLLPAPCSLLPAPCSLLPAQKPPSPLPHHCFAAQIAQRCHRCSSPTGVGD